MVEMLVVLLRAVYVDVPEEIEELRAEPVSSLQAVHNPLPASNLAHVSTKLEGRRSCEKQLPI